MQYQTYLENGNLLPAQLSTIHDPPKQLYWSGNSLSPLMKLPRVAIVGSRKVSPYGKEVTIRLANELAKQGVVIVSGLALGVDGLAHRGALEANGRTIAVLPCNLERLYPAMHQRLGKEIAEKGGCLVSEYGADDPFVYKYNFVARNRIISGLSDAVLITEAAEDSGSLHTAEFALQQGREVLVVPGNITSATSKGTNNLLKIGATPVTDVADVLRALNIEPARNTVTKRKGSTAAEQTVLDLIAAGVNQGEALLQQANLPAATFNQTLTMLEINGLVRAGGANTWY